MNPIPLIRASQIKPFSDFLDRVGAPIERLMRQARLPVFAVDEPDSLVSYYSLGKFLEIAASSEGIQDFGLCVAQESSIDDIGAFGEYLVSSPTLYIALERLSKMVTAHSSGSCIWINEQDDDIWLSRKGFKRMTSGQVHDEHYTLMVMVCIVRLAAGPRWWPSQVKLQACTKVPEGMKNEAFTDTVYSLGQDITAFPIPRSLLALPLQTYSALKSETTSGSQIQSALEGMPNDFEQSLKMAIAPYIHEYHPGIQVAAEITGLTVRTLQRRLDGIGLTYREMVDQVRCQAALRLIEDDTIKLSEIAMHVGYSDSAGFTRAFYRWTGTSPRKYRLQRLANS